MCKAEKAKGKPKQFQKTSIKPRHKYISNPLLSYYSVLVPWLKVSQGLNPPKPQKSFSLSNLSSDSKSEAFFFSGLSSLDLLCALPSWDFVSCNLVSMAFRLSRIGADILLAGQLQDPVQQIYNESTFFQRGISPPPKCLHILSYPKILQLIHPRVRKNTFTGQRRTHKLNRCCYASCWYQ